MKKQILIITHTGYIGYGNQLSDSGNWNWKVKVIFARCSTTSNQMAVFFTEEEHQLHWVAPIIGWTNPISGPPQPVTGPGYWAPD